jgi:hypothetical protein
MASQRVYLLSPARCSGRRAGYLMNERAAFELARRLRTPAGITLGEAFSFMSGLYFRGKLAYSNAFGRAPRGWGAAMVICPGRGLVRADAAITLDDLRAIASVPVDVDEPRYREPLLRDARRLAARLRGRAILLGSIATAKYVDLLLKELRGRLCFPSEFVGRGDMSRGGLMLRCVDDGRMLTYVPVRGAERRGPRPPRLPSRRARRATRASGAFAGD